MSKTLIFDPLHLRQCTSSKTTFSSLTEFNRHSQAGTYDDIEIFGDWRLALIYKPQSFNKIVIMSSLQVDLTVSVNISRELEAFDFNWIEWFYDLIRDDRTKLRVKYCIWFKPGSIVTVSAEYSSNPECTYLPYVASYIDKIEDDIWALKLCYGKSQPTLLGTLVFEKLDSSSETKKIIKWFAACFNQRPDRNESMVFDQSHNHQYTCFNSTAQRYDIHPFRTINEETTKRFELWSWNYLFGLGILIIVIIALGSAVISSNKEMKHNQAVAKRVLVVISPAGAGYHSDDVTLTACSIHTITGTQRFR